MLKNYLKIALRTLRRHRAYSLINIFGLALSMSVCLLIILLVRDQLSYDRFHEKADRIYRVITDELAASPAFVGPALERDVPGVEETVRLAQIRTNLLREGESRRVVGLYAEPSFFDVFSFRLSAGDVQDALEGPNKVLLSEAAARSIFGDADPMGQIVTLEGAGDFTVSGIVATEHVKSHLKFDVLASFATLETLSYGRERLAQEDNFWSFANYVLMEPGASTRPLDAYLQAASERYRESGQGYALKLQPLTGITLGPMLGNEISSFSLPLFVVLLFVAIAVVVMLATGFNYIGLTVARSLQRAKEVGIRKTVGAHRRQVIGQFLAESVLMALAAFVLAYGMLSWLVPGFNDLMVMQEFGIHLSATSIYDPRLAGIFLGFSLVVGLLAGLYPAFYLSRFDPVVVLKGAGLGRGHARLRLRKVLVTTQMVFSLVFIISGVLIYRQFEYMIEFDYGFRTADVLNVDLQGASYTQFRDEIIRHPGVREVAAVSEPPASGSTTGTNMAGAGSDTLGVTYYSVDAHFLNSLDIELVAGSNFAVDGPEDGVILNETAVRLLGFASPDAALGQDIYFGDASGGVTVIGVVEDYQFHHLLRSVTPMLLRYDPDLFSRALIRVHPGQTGAVAAHLESVWKQIDPVHPIEYTFYDSQLRHDNEGVQIFRDLIKVVAVATLIALAIACLGLLAMAAFNAELRTKEVGIRKVLGATVSSIAWLLSREFLLLVPVALLIAIPLAYFGNNLWLEQIANRVAFGPSIFIASTALLAILTLLAIGTQTVRAALANPAESLRYE